jgi:DNA-nicking Smr family endonuclease
MPPKTKAQGADPDTAAWDRAMRGVKKLAARPEQAPALIPKPVPVRAKPADNPIVARSAQMPKPALPALALDRFAGIDRANAERLKRGQHPVEARLDLHGMTQDEAHHALSRFIRNARGSGKRCVLVITGRGRMGGGVLRSAVPRWLNEPEFRPLLLAIATAQPWDGGVGALYVMLRRTQTD